MPAEDEATTATTAMTQIPAIISDQKSRAMEIAIKGSSFPATKTFAANATGNLFIASTLNGGEGSAGGISKEAQLAFGQVSVFFAAITKAMSESGQSLYNFDALNSLIKGSGLFVNVTKSDVEFSSESWGVTFGNEMIQALLGLSGDLSSVAASLTSLMSAVGKEGFELSKKNEKSVTNVGTIIFVCEYLLGAVSISPIVVYADMASNSSNFTMGPCFQSQSKTLTWKLKKEVHLFVPPVFMQEAATMNAAMDNPDFTKLVDKMVADIKGGSKDSQNNSQDSQDVTEPSA
ncbi:MAG: hypothetical protein ACI8WB_000067 [Phenylobacterium sp.]|jgi:hypothetical protein